MRSKKTVINILVSLLFEIVTVISAFLLPRLVIGSFGSGTNGVTEAVTKFIGYVSLLTAGIGGVTAAALYKPLADNDFKKISSIVNATEIFMKKISKIFLILLIIFAVSFPLFVINEFDYFYSLTLVFILGIGTFGNYYFGLTYRMVLSADQKQYIVNLAQIIVLILHTITAIALINVGANIHIVKLAGSLIFLITPLFIYFFVRKTYKIDKKVTPDFSTIDQRWDAFAHQMANFVNDNTDLLILVIFTNAKEASVYTVYFLVFNGIRAFVSSMITGVISAFGNMFAKGEIETVKKSLKLYEFLLHSTAIILYVNMALLITPFIDLYIKGVNDANYHRPIFGYLISAIGFFVAVRIPYEAVTRAAGHFKQTRNGAIIEVILNIVISLILVIPFGMIGLAIGTLVATIYRTIQYGLYTSKNIISRNGKVIFMRYFVSILNIVTILSIMNFIPMPEIYNFIDWIICGIVITVTSIIVTFIYNLIFYLEDIKYLKKLIKRLIKTQRKNIKIKEND